MANAIRARGIATFLKCSQKQKQAGSGGVGMWEERRNDEKGHKLSKTSWKSFGQQAVAALCRRRRRRRRLGLSVGQNFPAYVCHIYAWAARAQRAALSGFPGCNQNMRLLRQHCSASDSCRLLQTLHEGGTGRGLELGPLVTVLKLSNMPPPWTVPQQLTDKCRWPGSKYCWKHFLISWHPARPSPPSCTAAILLTAVTGTANF